MIYNPYVGQKVRFLPNLWDGKKEMAIRGGLFGAPLSPDHPNEFTILGISDNVDFAEDTEEDIECELEDYPWLVYLDELEVILNVEPEE